MSIVYMMFILYKIYINLNQNNQVDEILLFNASCKMLLIHSLKFSTDFTNCRVKFSWNFE